MQEDFQSGLPQSAEVIYHVMEQSSDREPDVLAQGCRAFGALYLGSWFVSEGRAMTGPCLHGIFLEVEKVLNHREFGDLNFEVTSHSPP